MHGDRRPDWRAKWLSFILAWLAMGLALILAQPTRVQAPGVAVSSGLPVLSRPAAQSPVSVTLESYPNPSSFGEPVTITATVDTGELPVSGTVTLTIDSTVVFTQVVSTSPAVVTHTTNTLAVGDHPVHVDYADDAHTDSADRVQHVDVASTHTLVESSSPSTIFGETVYFTATVTAIEPGSGIPLGTVQFRDGTFDLGAPIPLFLGSASLYTSTLAVGSHSIFATYSGGTNFNGSSSSPPLDHTVTQADTTMAVEGSGSPSVFGQTVYFTATVNPVTPSSGIPDGSVRFQVDGADLGGSVGLSGGRASISTTALAAGAHMISGLYSGSERFYTSTAMLSGGQDVNSADTHTDVSATVSSTVFGQTVGFTATVTANAPGSGTPGGTVQFRDNDSILGNPVSLVDGRASFYTSTLAIGTHVITADYGGDGNFTLSSGTLSPNLLVDRANTTTTVAASLNPTTLGQTVYFIATVNALAAGSGIPGGNVQFKDNGSNLGVGTLNGGTASISTSSLTAGTHTITAEYGGQTNFNPSTGTLSPSLIVNKVNTTTRIDSHLPNPSLIGQAVTIQFSVTFAPPWTPTGSVTVTDGTSFCTAPVSAGSCGVVFNTPGPKTLTATYAGDSNLASSTSLGVSHVVIAQYSLYLPSLVKTGPRPGAWQSQTNDEFNVSPAGDSVQNFTIYINIPSCSISHYKITHTLTEPIVNNHVSFTGSFYADITFDSETTAHGYDGLSNFTVPGCGTSSAGPWYFTATWQSSTPLALPVGRSLSAPNAVEPIFPSVPWGRVVQPP